MQYFIIPMWIMLVAIILAWAGVVYIFWFKPKIDDYFAHRRHLRRIRNYSGRGTLYDEDSIHHNNIYIPTKPKKVPSRATARHRR